jgi:hypothetical protein
LPAPLLFNLDRRNGWSLTEGELDAYMEENPQPVHNEEATEESVQPSNIAEFPYQQPYYDYTPSASSSQGPSYYFTNDDPPAWGMYDIDLHLGQKPKLGGRYTDDSLIYISYFVGPMYIHVSLSLLFSFLLLLPKTQKDQKYFRCFSLFAFLVSNFALLAIFGLIFEKSKNILLCLLFLSILISKIENPKIFVVLLRFCKVCCRVLP